MAGFKKKLPMSAALRQGGEGTVPPDKAGGFDLGRPKSIPKAPKIGKGMPPFPKFNKGGGAKR